MVIFFENISIVWEWIQIKTCVFWKWTCSYNITTMWVSPAIQDNQMSPGKSETETCCGSGAEPQRFASEGSGLTIRQHKNISGCGLLRPPNGILVRRLVRQGVPRDWDVGCCSRGVVDLHEAMDNTLVWGSQVSKSVTFFSDFPSELSWQIEKHIDR